MSAFQQYFDRHSKQHGARFSHDDLCAKFIPHFHGRRIKVRFPCGTVKTGTVSGTTGWRPSLMLMLSGRAHGSPWLLDDRCELLAIQDGHGKYRPVVGS